MNDRRWAYLGYACIVGMLLAAWVAQEVDWPIDLLAVVGGLALMLDRRRA